MHAVMYKLGTFQYSPHHQTAKGYITRQIMFYPTTHRVVANNPNTRTFVSMLTGQEGSKIPEAFNGTNSYVSSI